MSEMESSSLIVKPVELPTKVLAEALRLKMELNGVIQEKPRWIPHTPTPKQQIFLNLNCLEALYGGAAGGGKSDALLMAALQYVDIPGYSALLLRRTFPQLEQPDSLIPRSHNWLSNTAAEWSERKKQWKFPSGAILRFGHMENELAKLDYQSSMFQLIGFDELTQYTESQYTYMFSRLRRTEGLDMIPLRQRGGTNPSSNPEARWVFERFIDGIVWEDPNIGTKEVITSGGKSRKIYFVPARLDDNPHLDQIGYEEALDNLDTITRAQLLHGDWNIQARGNIFDNWDEKYHVITRSEFKKVFKSETIPPKHWNIGRFFDRGYTEGHPGVITWISTAAKNSALPGLVVIFRERVFSNPTIGEIGREIQLVESYNNEADRVTMSLMSHEGKGERNSLSRDYKIQFSPWETDRTGGIAIIRDYLELIDLDKPNPFRPQLNGRPRLVLVVADDQGELIVNPYSSSESDQYIVKPPKDHDGLARLRAEMPAYRWSTNKSGTPTAVLVPHRLFNDAIDTIRAAAMQFFPAIKRLNRREKLEEDLPEHLQARTLMTIEDLEERAGWAIVRQMEKRALMAKYKQKIEKPIWL